MFILCKKIAKYKHKDRINNENSEFSEFVSIPKHASSMPPVLQISVRIIPNSKDLAKSLRNLANTVCYESYFQFKGKFYKLMKSTESHGKHGLQS